MRTPLTAIPRAPRSDAVRNRAAVIGAARKVMAKKGVDAGMDEIARAAGVGVGTVYRHFPTKDDLILGVIRARFERLAARAEAELENPDAWSGLEATLRFGAELQAADKGLSQCIGYRAAGMDEMVAETGLPEAMEELIARALEQGSIRAGYTARDVGPMMCSLAATMVTHSEYDWNRLLTVMLDGIRATEREPLPQI
jgi:AcrR family transcriptional regulator